ncbi:MAG: AAA family ATPase [Pseudomonadota bacterium]|nr:AAA family ATPase [Pseudomonadota bacterium]
MSLAPLLRQLGLDVREDGPTYAVVRGVPTRSAAFVAPLPRFRTPLLDWAPDWPVAYPQQDQLLTWGDPDDGFVLPQVVLFDRADLGDRPVVSIAREGSVFTLAGEDSHPVIVALKAARGPALLTNGRWARLAGWNARDRRLTVQECSYYAWLILNVAADGVTDSPGAESPRAQGSQGRLAAPGGHDAADQIGINVLLVTSDGKLLYHRRGDRPLIRPRELAAAASGTVGMADLPTASTSFDLDTFPAVLASLGSLGLQPADVAAVRFLGLTRELIRSGTPDLTYVALTSLTAAAVQGRWELRSDVDPVGWVFVPLPGALTGALDRAMPEHEVVAAFEELLTRLAAVEQGRADVDALSVPMLTNLVLWASDRARIGARRVSVPALVEVRSSPSEHPRRWRRMKIRDVRMFHDTTVELSAGLNVVFGANGSGKTTLLRLLYAQDGTLDRNEVRTRVWERAFLLPDGRVGSLVRAGAATGSVGFEADIGTERLSQEVMLGPGGVTAANVEGAGIPASRRVGSTFIPSTDVIFLDSLAKAVSPHIREFVDLATADLLAALPSGAGEEPWLLPDYLARPMGRLGSWSVSRSGPGAELDLGRGGANVPARSAADGWKRVALIDRAVGRGLSPRHGRLYWDEPDLSLHPNLFPHVAELIVRLALSHQVQVVVATHNYDLLQWIDGWAEKLRLEATNFICLAQSEAHLPSAPILAHCGQRLTSVPNPLAAYRYMSNFPDPDTEIPSMQEPAPSPRGKARKR